MWEKLELKFSSKLWPLDMQTSLHCVPCMHTQTPNIYWRHDGHAKLTSSLFSLFSHYNFSSLGPVRKKGRKKPKDKTSAQSTIALLLFRSQYFFPRWVFVDSHLDCFFSVNHQLFWTEDDGMFFSFCLFFLQEWKIVGSTATPWLNKLV